MATLASLITRKSDLQQGVITQTLGNGQAEVVVAGQKRLAFVAGDGAKKGTRCLVAVTGSGVVAIAGMSGSGGGKTKKVVLDG